MRLASWNVNSLTAREPRVLEWLAEQQPDVICLQETKQDDARFPYGTFAECGYEAAHHGEGRWNGVAILSRTPLTEVVRGFGSVEDETGARFLRARVQGIDVMSCYVPNGRALDDPFYEKKLSWLDRLAEVIAGEAGGQPIVVAGDFNVAPTDDDVWDPAALVGQTHVSAPERERLAALFALGLDDVVRRHLGQEKVFSWWDYRAGAFHRGWGMRIDLVLASKEIGERVTAAWIDRNARKGVKPSDHAPVVIEFDWP